MDSNPIDLLSLSNFRMAFNFYYESSDEFKVLDDPRYMHPVVQYKSQNLDTGEDLSESLRFHRCTQADYELFYPTEESNKHKLVAI